MGCRKLFLEVFGHDLMFFGIFQHNLSKVVGNVYPAIYLVLIEDHGSYVHNLSACENKS